MQYIILLRGINVGGRKIKMAELKTSFEKAGFGNVQTVLQTGNVIVESNEKNSSDLQRKVEAFLEKDFHYPAQVRVIKPKYLQSVIEQYPFSGFGPEFHRYAVFTDPENVRTLVKAHAGRLDKTIEAVKEGDGVVYWRVLKGHTLDSHFGKGLPKSSSKYFITNRNLNTLEKILKKCE